jgi:O-antigen ligase
MTNAHTIKENLSKFKWLTPLVLIYRRNDILLFTFLFVLFLLCPFAVDNNLAYSVQYAKFFFFISLARIIAILLFIRLITIKKIEISSIDIAVSLLFIYQLMGIIFNFGSLTIPFDYPQSVGLMIVYIAVRACGKSLANYLFVLIIFTTVLQAVYGTLQLHDVLPSNNRYFKITGSFFNPAPFSGFLAIVTPIALCFYLFECPITLNRHFATGVKILSLICILLAVIVLPSTASRAAWLACGISSVFVFVLTSKYRRWIKNFKTTTLLFFALTILVVFGVFMYLIKKDSADGRLAIWKISLNLVKEKPLFGHGYGKFKSKYMESQAAYFKAGLGSQRDIILSDNVQYPYNEIIRIAVEYGLFGLCIIGVIFFLLFYSGPDSGSMNFYTYAARGGLISLVIFSFFSYPSEIIPVLLLGTFCVAVIANHKTIIFKSVAVTSKARLAILTSAAITIAVSLQWSNKNIDKKSVAAWKKANDLYQIGDYKLSLFFYEKGYPLNKTNGLFLSNYAKALSICGQYKLSNKISVESSLYLTDNITFLTLGDNFNALGDFRMAETCYQKACLMVPSRLYPKYCLAKLYFKTNQKEKALSMANKILATNSKIKSTAEMEIKREMKTLLQHY